MNTSIDTNQHSQDRPHRSQRPAAQRAALALAPALAALLTSIALAQPNKGDLAQYETDPDAIASNRQPNLLFIADTSGSMQDYLAEERDNATCSASGTIPLDRSKVINTGATHVYFDPTYKPCGGDNQGINKGQLDAGSQLKLTVENITGDNLGGGLYGRQRDASGGLSGFQPLCPRTTNPDGTTSSFTFGANTTTTCTVDVSAITSGAGGYQVQVWLINRGAAGRAALGSSSELNYTPRGGSGNYVVDIRAENIYLRRRGTTGNNASHWDKASATQTVLNVPGDGGIVAGSTRTPGDFCDYFHGDGAPNSAGATNPGYDKVYIGTSPHSNSYGWFPAGDITHPVAPPNEVYLKDSDASDPDTLYVCRHKGTTMTEAIADLAQNAGGINMGLMRFNRREETDDRDVVSAYTLQKFGGTPVFHVQSVKAKADLDKLLDKIGGDEKETLGLHGTTPLADTLAEAYRYFKGDTAKYARGHRDTATPNTNYWPDPDAFTTAGVYDTTATTADTRKGKVTTAGTYQSPIQHSCQSNNIILLSDGAPSFDYDGAGLVSGCSADWPGVVTAFQEYAKGNITSTQFNAIAIKYFADSLKADGTCLDEIAAKLATEDLSSKFTGDQTVTTYTVGFDIDLELLKEAAKKGKGEYFTAKNSADLNRSLRAILQDINKAPGTVAPSVSVNSFNKLQHRTDFYYATFSPSVNPAWEGNLKRYKFKNGKIIDAAGNEAVCTTADTNCVTGNFKPTARSFWSATTDGPDGGNVTKGGYRAKQTKERVLYLPAALFDSTKTGITKVAKTDLLKPTAFGLPNAAEAKKLRDWLLGVDVNDYNRNNDTTDAHQYVSEGLHSSPFVITYSGTETTPVDIVFTTTNLGALRAIDAREDKGQELWSYIPEELAKNANTYRLNDPTKKHYDVYGLDGQSTLWVTEPKLGVSGNRKVDKVRLYQGMRRGGKTYFAWDLSNADKDIGGDSTQTPISELWKITGGDTGFEDLGFTWSKMLHTKLRYGCTGAGANATNCTAKEVLVFSGGYDGYYDEPDNTPKTSTDSGNTLLGRAVYIVDALTGAKLWSAGPSSAAGGKGSHKLELPLYNSVPGDPAVLDINGDGYVDTLYIVDIAGNLFRIDFNHSKALTDSDYATGGQVAQLDTDTTKTFRRFYNGPDVALFAEARKAPYLTVSVGSGYRANPFAKETAANANRFFVLVDDNVQSPARYGGTGTNKNDITYKYVETRNNASEITGRDIIKPANLHHYKPPTKTGTSTTPGDPYDPKARAGKGTSGNHGFYRELEHEKEEKILQTSTTFDGDVLVASYLPVKPSTTTSDSCSNQIGQSRLYKFSAKTGKSTFVINRPNNVQETVEHRTLLSATIPSEPSILLVPKPVVCIGNECFDDVLNLEELGRAERVYWREEQP